jgi:hypothetical protein
VTISGTVVYVKGRGYYRQDWTKSAAGFRTLVLPRFAVAVLLRRYVAARPNPCDAVSPPVAAPGCRLTTCAANGGRSGPTPAWSG